MGEFVIELTGGWNDDRRNGLISIVSIAEQIVVIRI